MAFERRIILRDDDMEALGGRLNLDQLKDLQVVLVNFTGESEWTDVDYVDIGVFD